MFLERKRTNNVVETYHKYITKEIGSHPTLTAFLRGLVSIQFRSKLGDEQFEKCSEKLKQIKNKECKKKEEKINEAWSLLLEEGNVKLFLNKLSYVPEIEEENDVCMSKNENFEYVYIRGLDEQIETIASAENGEENDTGDMHAIKIFKTT